MGYKLVGWMGRYFLTVGQRLNQQFGFAGRILILTWEGRSRSVVIWPLILDEIYKIVISSLLLLGVTGVLFGFMWSFVGFVLLSEIINLDSLSLFLVNIHIMEITPIMVAVIVLLRYGAPTTWELAVMKSSHQFETLAPLGIPPEHYLVAPRIIGTLLAFPGLLAFFNLSSGLGAYAMAWGIGPQSVADFIFSLSDQTKPWHFFIIAYKSVVISLAVSFFCVYNGFDIETGTLPKGRTLISRAMGESLMYIVFLSMLVSIGSYWL